VPDRLDADVSRMVIGDMLRVGDLIAPEGVEILTNPEEAVLGVVVPQVLKVEEEVPAEVELAEGEEVPAEAAEGEEGAAPAAEGGGGGESEEG
jgi:large subunit ribosomal protein L25